MSLPIEEEEAVTDAPMTVDLYEGKVRTSRATRSKTTHISKTSDVADGGDEVISVTTAAGAGVEQGLAILGANTHEISSQSLESRATIRKRTRARKMVLYLLRAASPAVFIYGDDGGHNVEEKQNSDVGACH